MSRRVLTDVICRIGTPEVTQLVANLSAIYSPELKVGFTPVRHSPPLCRSCTSSETSCSRLAAVITRQVTCAKWILRPADLHPELPPGRLPCHPGLRACGSYRRPHVPQQRYVQYLLHRLSVSHICGAGDLSDREGYDFEQIKSIAKVQVRVWVLSIIPKFVLITNAVCDPLACGLLRSAERGLILESGGSGRIPHL